MINKTEAIVIRVTPFSRTSHIVSWLTAGSGKVATVIKGACRPKSGFVGQYDLFYTCELLFYARERGGLHIAKECCPLATRSALRGNWRAALLASYACDLVSRTTESGHAQPETYHLLTLFLDHVASVGTPRPNMAFWFELRLMAAIGLAPQLRCCAACGGTLSSTDAVLFSAERGGCVCPTCAPRTADDTTIPLPRDVLAILQTWQAAAAPRAPQNTNCTRRQVLAFRDVLGVFCSRHLAPPPLSRDIVIQMLEPAGLAQLLRAHTPSQR